MGIAVLFAPGFTDPAGAARSTRVSRQPPHGVLQGVEQGVEHGVEHGVLQGVAAQDPPAFTSVYWARIFARLSSRSF